MKAIHGRSARMTPTKCPDRGRRSKFDAAGCKSVNDSVRPEIAGDFSIRPPAREPHNPGMKTGLGVIPVGVKLHILTNVY